MSGSRTNSRSIRVKKKKNSHIDMGNVSISFRYQEIHPINFMSLKQIDKPEFFSVKETLVSQF
jgi:hypothetical protein